MPLRLQVWFLFGALFCGVSIPNAAPPLCAVPEAALLTNSIEVPLVSGSAGTIIRFTLDGSEPTATLGTEHHAPLQVSQTRIVRFAAFRDGRRVSEVGTRSYLRLDQVAAQSGTNFPAHWGSRNEKPVPAHYRMSSEILSTAPHLAELVAGLLDLPTISLVANPADLFGSERGIYAHPMEHGDDWERPCSLEYFPSDGSPRVQVNAGIRIQGGWNRRPEESPKHAFRIVFRSKYGPGVWKYPLFGSVDPTEFNSLILRAGCNNSWLHWSGVERSRGDYIRDQWMRDSARDMGLVSARGHFVHLYLNGLYWGIYNITERPDAAFVASVWGGKRSDYDVRNGDNVIMGDETAWKELFAAANRPPSDQVWSELARRLDLDAFADYMLLNLYGANGDWDRSSNWYAARPRKEQGKFVFFVWDGERTLERVDDNTMTFDDDLSPSRLFHRLRSYEEFRLLMGRRAQRHLLNPEGALHPKHAGNRFRLWAERLKRPMIAESARWGAYRRDVHPYKTGPFELYTRETHWSPEMNRLLTDYFPRRTGVFVQQLEKAGLVANRKTE